MNNAIFRVVRRFSVALTPLYAFLLFGFNSDPALAAKETRPELICSKAFPCPPEIVGRVFFWIDVYSRWNSNDAIFHDKKYPSRVYKVVVGETCGGASGSPAVEAYRRGIAGELRTLANQLKAGQSSFNSSQRTLLSLFPTDPSYELERAADRIRCQGGNRDRFEQALNRFTRYSPLVTPVLRDAGLPSDIKYLPFVESLYNPVAYSRAGAAGLWQIMPGTARELGLKLTAELDERLDPELASQAAARYFVRSFHALMAAAKKLEPDSTPTMVSPFIVTSYNYGINGMRRAIEQKGPDYVAVVNSYRSPAFQVAVKNFYASFLAARYVAKNADIIFPKSSRSRALEYETIVLRNPVSVERITAIFGVEEDVVKSLNPALTRLVWYGWRLVPAGYRLRLPARKEGWIAEQQQLLRLPAEASYQVTPQYKVKRGDTACAIAATFQVRCHDLITMNSLGRDAGIQVGQTIHIPLTSQKTFVEAGSAGEYRLRRGDTVCAIANRFDIPCQDLLDINGLTRSSIVQAGQTILVPGSSYNVLSDRSYIVREGDSACIIAERFNVSCQLLLVKNGLNSHGLIFPGQKLVISSAARNRHKAIIDDRRSINAKHIVRRGDTICEIAERYAISCKQLMILNGLHPESVIYIDQVLFLSARDISYVVRAGDTACEIASKYEVNCLNLIAENRLNQDGEIIIGQKLIIPKK